MPNNALRTKQTTPVIAVIGADGTGKSTILKELVNGFKHESVSSIYLFDERSSTGEPGVPIKNYTKPPRSNLVSFLKIFTRAVLWTIKYYFQLLPMRRKGVLVLCDQFYFLNIVLDPMKYRVGWRQSVSAWFLSKPTVPTSADCRAMYY